MDSDPPANAPETTRDLTPTRLYIAEIIAIPVFLLAPLTLLLLGGGMALDYKQLKQNYNIDFPDKRYLYYLMPFVLGHLGSLVYRTGRRQMIAHSRGFTQQSGLQRRFQNQYNGQSRLISAWGIIQFLMLLLTLVAPKQYLDPVATATALVFLANIVIGPILAGLDQRTVTATKHVEWIWTRYLLVLLSALPLGILVYLIHRMDHLYYAMLIEHWDAPADEFELDNGEKSRLERFADQFAL